MLGTLKQIYRDTSHNRFICRRFDDYLHSSWTPQSVTPLTRGQREDYLHYYRSFGFRYVNPAYAELLTSVRGEYDRRYIPDDLFNLYIDPIYPEIRDQWQNKCYQPAIVPEAEFPETLFRCVNGYYLDPQNRIVSESDVLRALRAYEEVVVKPSVFTGGGLNVRFFGGESLRAEDLRQYCGELVIQKPIEQSTRMAAFNPTSVNTDKIISFLFRGEVYILCAVLRMPAAGQRCDNLGADKDTLAVPVHEDGTLYPFGLDRYCMRHTETNFGEKLDGIRLDFHRECLDIIRAAHRRLVYFPIVSWDFAQKKDGSPVLIEYNLKWHSTVYYQLGTGAFFGELTDEVLREAAKKREDNRSLLYR